jgi:membrane-anchored protein YejM (alkaline phosphatase superfamily)
MDVHGPHTPFRGLNQDIHNVPASFHSGEFNDWDVNISDGLGDYEKQVQLVRELYAAEIDYLDRVLHNTIRTIRNQTERDTIFIITADHGENLGYETEDYLMNHVASLSEALLHVPFDIVGPIEQESISGLTTHADFISIVQAIKNGNDLNSFERETAKAEIIGSGSNFPDEGDKTYWDRSQRVIYQNKQKYYCDKLGNEAVYDVSGEPSTQHLLPNIEVPAELFNFHFVPWINKNSKVDPQTDMDNATQSRLEDLGYL